MAFVFYSLCFLRVVSLTHPISRSCLRDADVLMVWGVIHTLGPSIAIPSRVGHSLLRRRGLNAHSLVCSAAVWGHPLCSRHLQKCWGSHGEQATLQAWPMQHSQASRATATSSKDASWRLVVVGVFRRTPPTPSPCKHPWCQCASIPGGLAWASVTHSNHPTVECFPGSPIPGLEV